MYGQRGRDNWQQLHQHQGQQQHHHQQQQPGYGQLHHYRNPVSHYQTVNNDYRDHRQQHYAQQAQWNQQQPPSQHQYRSQTPNPRPHKRSRSSSDIGNQPAAIPHYQQQSQHSQQLQQRHDAPQLSGAGRQPPTATLQAQQHAGPSRAAAGQRPTSNHSNKAVAAWLDQLQSEILQFVQQVSPTADEQQVRQSCLAAFTNVARQALPHHARAMDVALFGSGAAGLALHHSDLDVAITGLVTPDGDKGGFEDDTKLFVVRCLRDIDRSLMYGSGRSILAVDSSRLVGRARIPVLKLQLSCGLELDVSLNDDGGARAASFLQSFQTSYPALRPLVLLLKSALKQRNLSEVYMGGLGSWSLANMVIAHLMEEDRAGHQVDHVGAMLLSFLRRYGVDFNASSQAVSVKKGGVVSKTGLGAGFARTSGDLALEDPLTGREVAGGSHRYRDVEECFRRLHSRLFTNQTQQQQGSSSRNNRRAPGQFDPDDDDDNYDAGNRSPTYKARIQRQRQPQGKQQQPSDYDLLDLVLDCKLALQRDAGAAAADAGTGMSNGAGGRWQWGNGAPNGSNRPVVGRKRDRW